MHIVKISSIMKNVFSFHVRMFFSGGGIVFIRSCLGNDLVDVLIMEDLKVKWKK